MTPLRRCLVVILADAGKAAALVLVVALVAVVVAGVVAIVGVVAAPEGKRSPTFSFMGLVTGWARYPG
jgi:hypothetical protein